MNQKPQQQHPHSNKKPPQKFWAPKSLEQQYAEGKAASISPVGTHGYYEARRRHLNPERYINLLILFGRDFPKRIKGRSKRGWTSPTKPVR
jgi:hypothetical protein